VKLALTTSGTTLEAHDLERLLALARNFDLPVSVCVNKWDVNPAMTERIERGARGAGARLVGRVRYDPAVSRVQVSGRAIVETPAASGDDVRALWGRLQSALEETALDEEDRAQREGGPGARWPAVAGTS
jgi:MinD superfamily P-loop ATPase